MVPVVEYCDSGTTGVFAGNLDRVFDGLGARVQQNRFFGKVARGVLCEKLAEANIRLVSIDPKKGVRETLRLFVRCLDDGFVGMTDGVDTNTASEIDDVVAIDVHEDCPFGALNVHGEGRRDPDGNNFVSALVEGKGLRSGDFGDDETFLRHIRGYAVHIDIVLRCCRNLN